MYKKILLYKRVLNRLNSRQILYRIIFKIKYALIASGYIKFFFNSKFEINLRKFNYIELNSFLRYTYNNKSILIYELLNLNFVANDNYIINTQSRLKQYQRDLFWLEEYYFETLLYIKSPDRIFEIINNFHYKSLEKTKFPEYIWQPYTVSNRLVHLIYLLVVWDKSPKIKNLLGDFCRYYKSFLDQMLEFDIGANHLLKNYFAIALFDLYFTNSKDSLKRYLGEFNNQFLEDGAHFEISPMYTAKIIADAYSIYLILEDSDEKNKIKELIIKSFKWVNLFHTNDGFINFNDSWDEKILFRKLSHIAEVFNIIEDLKNQKLDSGFLILRNKSMKILMDIGNISPAFNPSHSHSDLLSICLVVNDKQLIVDPGVAHYSPNDERKFFRSCHSHNGPCLMNEDHTEISGNFRIGKGISCSNHFFCDDTIKGTYSYSGYVIERICKIENNKTIITDNWTKQNIKSKQKSWLRFLFNIRINDIIKIDISKNACDINFVFNGINFLFVLQSTHEICLIIKPSYFTKSYDDRTLCTEVCAFSKDIINNNKIESKIIAL